MQTVQTEHKNRDHCDLVDVSVSGSLQPIVRADQLGYGEGGQLKPGMVGFNRA